MKKMTIFAAFAISAVIGLSACGSGSKEDQTKDTAASSETAAEVALPTEDRGGEQIDLPENVTKIVSLAPSTTQVIEDLGKKDQLIAVDNQSPMTTEDLEELPQFDMMAVDAEKLIALQPEVVYVTNINLVASDSVWTQVKNAGITVVNIPTSNSMADIALDVQFIADTLQEHEKGKQLVDTMNQEIEEIEAIGSTITDKKTVLFEISGLPDIYSFGKGVFLNEMIEAVGAENVLKDETSWIPVTEEAAIASKPDVVLTSVNYVPDPVGEILARENWQTVPAVKNKAVYQIDNATSSLPNHHITEALKEIAVAVYPDEYKDLADE